MLSKLSIKNFVLIDNLEVNFEDGLTIITGETGAGKSILLGGLSLILGKRADLSALKNSSKKCVIEGEFSLAKYQLSNFFKRHDIDYEELTIIRRELSPNGKSRAFINDTPVKLTVLNELSEKLIDIHSQHETLQLADVNFQFKIIDAFANTTAYLESYKEELLQYKLRTNELNELLRKHQEAKLQYDYNLFLLEELNLADLKLEEQEFLEEILEKLTNVESIKLNVIEALNIANNEEVGIKPNLQNFRNNLGKLAAYSKGYTQLLERITSLEIEFEDIANELENLNDEITASPQEIENYNDRLRLIYDLQKKHGVDAIAELLEIQELLANKVDTVSNVKEIIAFKNEEISKAEVRLNEWATKIHAGRVKAIPILTNQLEGLLTELSMKDTRFKINITKSNEFYTNGKDDLQFLVAANKGSKFESLKKVASGGEMSRIMLAVKSLLSKHTNLPTILFDEIDTGVSGEVSNKMATIMETMSNNMQVIAITHLPQIAAKGKNHFKVYKEEVNSKTITNIKSLNASERVNELAEMLGGKKILDSAIKHAKQLLG